MAVSGGNTRRDNICRRTDKRHIPAKASPGGKRPPENISGVLPEMGVHYLDERNHGRHEGNIIDKPGEYPGAPDNGK